jgi:hypothetical protein
MEMKSGDACYLVFKTQAFAPVANADTRTMDMVLNIISGVYRGENEDGKSTGEFLFETEAANGTGIVWAVRREDVLMLGVRRNTPRLASV